MKTLTPAEAAYLRKSGGSFDADIEDHERPVSRDLLGRGLIREFEHDGYLYDDVTPMGRLALACFVAVTGGMVGT
jgi:hypothetical protein